MSSSSALSGRRFFSIQWYSKQRLTTLTSVRNKHHSHSCSARRPRRMHSTVVSKKFNNHANAQEEELKRQNLLFCHKSPWVQSISLISQRRSCSPSEILLCNSTATSSYDHSNEKEDILQKFIGKERQNINWNSYAKARLVELSLPFFNGNWNTISVGEVCPPIDDKNDGNKVVNGKYVAITSTTRNSLQNNSCVRLNDHNNLNSLPMFQGILQRNSNNRPNLQIRCGSNQSISKKNDSSLSTSESDLSEPTKGADSGSSGKSDSSNNNIDDVQSKTKNLTSQNIISEQTRNQLSAIWTQSQSIPNIITITRIVTTPILSYLVFSHEYTYAMVGCALAAISDGLDGYIARNYDGETVLGTYLDPFADKLFINSLAFSLCYVDILPKWCVGIWLMKDILMIGSVYYVAAVAAKGRGHAVADPSKTPLKVEATWISKVNTVLQFSTIGLGLGLATVEELAVPTTLLSSVDIISSLSYITSATTIASGISYLDGKSVLLSNNDKNEKQDGQNKKASK